MLVWLSSVSSGFLVVFERRNRSPCTFTIYICRKSAQVYPRPRPPAPPPPALTQLHRFLKDTPQLVEIRYALRAIYPEIINIHRHYSAGGAISDSFNIQVSAGPFSGVLSVGDSFHQPLSTCTPRYARSCIRTAHVGREPPPRPVSRYAPSKTPSRGSCTCTSPTVLTPPHLAHGPVLVHAYPLLRGPLNTWDMSPSDPFSVMPSSLALVVVMLSIPSGLHW
jgi:hypothetical protein